MMSAPTNWIMGKEKLADRAPSVQLLNPIFSYVRGLLAAVLNFSWKKPSFCWYPWNTPLSTKLPTFCCKVNIESEQIDDNFELYDNWTIWKSDPQSEMNDVTDSNERYSHFLLDFKNYRTPIFSL